MHSTAADIALLWRPLFDGDIVPPSRVAEMLRPRSDVPSDRKRYGLGFWLHPRTDAVILKGLDAGVSFHSVCDPHAGITHTVISNWTNGAWPLARHLSGALTLKPLLPRPAGDVHLGLTRSNASREGKPSSHS
jgi:hypothetical protein